MIIVLLPEEKYKCYENQLLRIVDTTYGKGVLFERIWFFTSLWKFKREKFPCKDQLLNSIL